MSDDRTYPLLIIVIAAVGLGFCTWLMLATWRSTQWPTTTGKIIGSSVRKEELRRNRYGPDTKYTPIITYEYSVSGETYRSQRIGYGDYSSNFPVGGAYDKIKQYPLGSEATVHFNPKRPGESVLETRLPDTSVLLVTLVLVPFVLAAAGGAALYWATLRRRRADLELQ